MGQVKKSPKVKQETTPNKSRKTSSSKNSPKTSKIQSAEAKNSSKTNKTAAAGASSPKMINSSYEFGHRWAMVKPWNNTEAYKSVLDSVPLDQLVHFLANKVDDLLILTFCKVAALYVEQGRLDRAVAILTKLSESTRFGMAAMFLADGDKIVMNETFDILSRHSGPEQTSEINKLRNKFVG